MQIESPAPSLRQGSDELELSGGPECFQGELSDDDGPLDLLNRDLSPLTSVRHNSGDLSDGFSLDLEAEFFQGGYSDEKGGQIPDGDELLDLLQNDLASDRNRHDASLADGVMNINLMPDEAPTELCAGENMNPISPILFSLQQWLLEESNKGNLHLGQNLSSERAAMLRKVAVAFAIGKLLEHVRIAVSSHSQAEFLKLCSVENFAVHVLQDGTADEGWEMVGVDMISPAVSVEIVVASSCSRSCSESSADVDAAILGRHVSTVVTRHSALCCTTKTIHQDEAGDESLICYSLGVLMQFMFSGESIKASTQPANFEHEMNKDGSEQPHRLKSACTSTSLTLSYSTNTSVAILIKNLLDCNVQVTSRPVEAYSSLAEAIDDIHLLLREPNIFLFAQETTSLNKPTGKVYGRTDQISALADAFARVASTGKSEAFLIGGYSGSGKTKLVQSASKSAISSSSGVFLSRKFEAASSSPLSVVLSAFDDLCISLTSRYSETERQNIYDQLAAEFGDSLYLLVRAVPNVVRLAPSLSHASSVINDAAEDSEVNFFSLCNITQRFIRIVTCSSSPVIIFLDDLQWADAVSLGVIHTLLSDSASSVFVVGAYRDNEISPSHIVFGFCDWLSKFNVPLNMIKIGGVALDDVNSMVSDAIGMFPRVCRSLSEVVFLKTRGNPFFVQTFIRSLVDKGLLTYSLRERRWLWDMKKIHTENITPNVLDLLSSKMTFLSQNVQTALKIASCFGIKVDSLIVLVLCKTPQYSSLMNDLKMVVVDGLMDFDDDTSYFIFVHDNVREAAYGMISSDTKDKFHFEIGLNLLNNCMNQPEVKSQCMYAILDQINHGVPSLCDESQSISIAKLNLEAGLASMLQSNYTSGYNFARSAISLLPEGSWETRYDLCLRLYSLLAKTAYSCNQIDEAKNAVNEVVEHASSPRDKLNGYVIQHSIVMNTCDPSDVLILKSTMLQLLKSLGEHMPQNMSENIVECEVAWAIEHFETHSAQDHLHMYTNVDTNNQAVIIQAYAILALLASITNPHITRYYVARWIQFCMKHKVASKYIPAAYVSFAAILCQGMNQNMSIGYRVGKLGLKLLGAISSVSELPEVYAIYYGHVGVLFEPMQAVVEMHRKAFEVGYQVGSLSIAAFHKMYHAVRQFYGGTHLVRLKEELEHGFKSEEYHCSFPLLGKKLNNLYQRVVCLIGDEETPIVSHAGPESEVCDDEQSFILREVVYLTYRGHFERVAYMAKRDDMAKHQWRHNLRSVYVCFYSCLSMLVIGRRKKPNQSKIKQLLSVVKLAARYSAWNFQNKVALINAERLSLSEMNQDAEVQYCTAIETAHSSKFVHEEGLACELAGMHYERIKNNERAVASFKRAQKCYDNWGSQMKVCMMQEKIQHLSRKPSQS